MECKTYRIGTECLGRIGVFIFILSILLKSCVCDRMDFRLVIENKLEYDISVLVSEKNDSNVINTHIRCFNSNLKSSRSNPNVPILDVVGKNCQESISLNPDFVEQTKGLFIIIFLVNSLESSYDQRTDLKKGVDYKIFYYSRKQLEANNWKVIVDDKSFK